MRDAVLVLRASVSVSDAAPPLVVWKGESWRTGQARECGGMPATFRRHDDAHTAPTAHHLQLTVGQPSSESRVVSKHISD